MDDIELKAEIDELKANDQATVEAETDLIPTDVPPAKPPKKEDGIFGVFTYQMILGVVIAICYVLCLTLYKTETNAVTQKLQQKLVTDFSFQQTVYTTVGNIFSYLNNIAPADVGKPATSEDTSSDIEVNTAVSSDSSTSSELPSSDESTSSEQTSSVNTQSVLTGAGGDFQEADGAIMPTNATFAPVIFTGSILYPIKKGAITSKFGFRINPTNNKPDFHNALDIAAPRNTSVRAAADGIVIKSEFDESLGNFIRIQHAGGFVTTYGHCERLIAKVGTHIKEGEIIAKVGSTGDSTGPHLHFGTAVNGIYFDPTYLYDTKLGLS